MDMQTAIKYFQKLGNYPGEVDEFLQSKLFGDYVAKLNLSYNLPKDYIAELMIEVVVNDFSLDFINQLPKKLQSDLSFDDTKAKDLYLDFLGRILLPINNFLKNLDVRSIITSLGGDLSIYKYNIEKLNLFLENIYFEKIEEIVKEQEKSFNVKEEEIILQNMIEKEFVYLLENPEAELNAGMIAVFFANASFKDTIVRSLLANQKKLFEKEIVVDGKRFIPTVGNWLNDFIAKNGSNYFNNIALSTYVTNSKVTKGLSKEEKDLLIKLFYVYRNIKFFPQSFQDIAPEKWEIFPIEKTNKSNTESRQSLATPKSPEEQEIETLEKMAAGYALGSLERRAVEEEIRKMKLSIRYQGIKK